MSGSCPICLGVLVEPVCIPCGHVYCTQCLAAHVNSPNNTREIAAKCPTCRFDFYTVTPDLTYLPKKYHQYVLPAVRRVYTDDSAMQSSQEKLLRAEARIKKLENDQETLMKKCEALIAASQAHALCEHDALQEIERLKKKLNKLMTHMKDTEAQQDQLENSVNLVRWEVSYWKSKYSKLKERYQCMETLDSADNSTLLSKRKIKSTVNSTDSHCGGITQAIEYLLETPKTRHIKPIPRRVTRPTSTQSQEDTAERSKRPRVSIP